MILLIDNYDSFVHNLARYLVELGCEVDVVRNDAVTVADVEALEVEAIVLSPGPCTPEEAGISVELVRRLGERLPILGVCLGHQAIAAAWGAAVVHAPEPVHGRTDRVRHDRRGLFEGLPDPLIATRYHSLAVDEQTLPPELRVTATTDDGVVMALAHRDRPVFGVQFHPESVLTDGGHRLLWNFLCQVGLCSGVMPDVPAVRPDDDPAPTGDDPAVPLPASLRW